MKSLKKILIISILVSHISNYAAPIADIVFFSKTFTFFTCNSNDTEDFEYDIIKPKSIQPRYIKAI